MQRVRVRGQAVSHLIVAILVAGCSGGGASWTPATEGWPYPHPIYWQQYRPGLQSEIDKAGESADCDTLYSLFGEALDLDADNPEVLTYISRWGKHDQCERFTTEARP
jgi:hypothetical protein